MHEIMRHLTKSGKKAFNKLSDEEKAKIIQANVIDKISDSLAKAITEATIRGMDYAYEYLYQNYVTRYDNKDEEFNLLTLSSYLRIKHLEHEQRKNKENDPNIQ